MNKLLFILFLCCSFQINFAQQTENLTDNITQLDQIQYLDAGMNNAFLNPITNNSQVYILQQGAFNSATVTSIGSDIEISILQNGDRNAATVKTENVSLQENILQNGNNNSVISYYFGYDQPVTSEVIQNGNNLTLEKYGVNSYTDRIRVNMEGNSRTVIIRSY
ncbi:hypothetical protein [Ascidiimonas sp. W6]|uniref:hypothetical protein n=1 Tax=Ascidiimonas meishanensis TaxID=3128903 RepID=UPI0030EE4E3F